MEPNGATATLLPDLDSRQNIRLLIDDFYREVSKDDLLGPIFNVLAEVDWSEHKELLTNYWCRILLREMGYDGAILVPHKLIQRQQALTPADFDRWISLFEASVDRLFEGEIADRAKHHASKIATILAKRVASETWVRDERVLKERQ